MTKTREPAIRLSSLDTELGGMISDLVPLLEEQGLAHIQEELRES